ncbi:hypothetical protein [Jeotgalibacillus aurantiacus]|uniref:hypothetical protein n=1 Tax=Jeotgalibacillus aurantiacus TaxID=2763266 RepID=UPI001D0BCDF5|nr:hypothetical protein [Jeotgalibacillus aurantiacus]
MFFILIIHLLLILTGRGIYTGRSFISERYAGASVSLVAGAYGISTAVWWGIYVIPSFWTVVLSVAAGFGIGWLSGQGSALIAGAMHGLASGVMGTMLAAALQNPALCGIPVQPVDYQLVVILVTAFFGVSVLLLEGIHLH